MSYKEIELDRIKASPLNPRKAFGGPKDDELAASIKAKGVLQPIVIRPDGNGFEIVAGERRWRAACKVAEENGGLAGKTIPAMIRGLSDEEAFEFMTIENLQREDLTELEEAQGFKVYLDRKGEAGILDLAEKTGIDARYIRRRVRVLSLPAPVLQAWEKGKLLYGHLEQLRRLEDEKEILEIYAEMTRPNPWHEEGERTWPIATLKKRINEKAIDLKAGLFEKKDCKTCGKNSLVQKELFGLDDARARCLDPACFKQKQNNWLMANWKKTRWAKEHKTNGFRFEDSLPHGDFEHMYGQLRKECLACEKFVSRIPMDSSDRRWADAVCLDRVCYRRLFHSSAAQESGKTREEYKIQKRGEIFRESFYTQKLPLAIGAVPPDDTRSLRLALVAMLHERHDLVEWFAKKHKSKKGRMSGYWYQGAPEIWPVVKEMSREDILKDLQEAALQVTMEIPYGPAGRHLAAEHFGIELEKEWVITEDYLKAHTIKEILAMGKKLGFWQDKKAQAYLYEKLGKKRGAFESCKKTELIKVVLKSGIDLAGKVPEEILKVGK